MTRPGDQPHDERDPRLAELLSDAVSDVEPANRLDAIRNETKVTSMSSRRPWLYAVGGAVVATAAVITAIAAAGGTLPGQGDDDPAPAGQSEQATNEPHDRATTRPSRHRPRPRLPPSSSAVPVYFVGDTPQRPPALPRVPEGRGRRPARRRRRHVGGRQRRRPGLRHPVAAGVSVSEVTSDGADIITVSAADCCPTTSRRA